MPSALITLGLGLAAGIAGASYGAYKDSPHESFLLRRVVRELVIAVAFAASFVLLDLDQNESPFILYLSFFALTRTATEFWKLFVRVEPQGEYRIPTQIHWIRGVVNSRVVRFALGLGFLLSIYGIYSLGTVFADTPTALRGLLIGLCIGGAEAIGGAYKDGSIEGFHLLKFFKSPTFGALGGLVASGHTGNIFALLLASIGTMRMLLELVFKMVVPDYVPGKFRSVVGPHVEWTKRRHIFLVPYACTWALYLVLATRPDWVAADLAAAPPPTAADVSAPQAAVSECGAIPIRAADAHQYLVQGRVGTSMLASAWHRIGGARLTTSAGETGNGRVELLIGTDPIRAPMGINQWHYLAETVCGESASLVGITAGQTQPRSLVQALDWVAGDDRVSAIRASSSAGVVETARFRLPFSDPTYEELDAVLRSIPARGPGERTAVPPNAQPSFLVAVTDLAREADAKVRAGEPASDLRQVYVHDGKTYVLAARATPSADESASRLSSGQAVDVHFTVRNEAQADLASFDLLLGRSGSELVPLRANYWPRWWLEIRLVLVAPDA